MEILSDSPLHHSVSAAYFIIHDSEHFWPNRKLA